MQIIVTENGSTQKLDRVSDESEFMIVRSSISPLADVFSANASAEDIN